MMEVVITGSIVYLAICLSIGWHLFWGKRLSIGLILVFLAVPTVYFLIFLFIVLSLIPHLYFPMTSSAIWLAGWLEGLDFL